MNKTLTGYPSIDKPWLKYYTPEAINASAPEGSLYDYMHECNKDHLRDVALDYFGRKMTYKELFIQTDVVAKAFIAQGVKPGDVCTIVTVSCVASVLCFYALNKIGAVSNFINVLSSQEDLETYFKDANSDLVVTLDLFGAKVLPAAKATDVKKVVVYSLSEWMPPVVKAGFALKMHKLDRDFMDDPLIVRWKDFIASARGQADIQYKKSPDTVCCLAHTGGTTGFPKTVLLNDRALNIVAQQYENCVIHERQQVFLSVMIPFVIYGTLTNIHMPLCLGLRTVIIPKFEASEWPNYIKRYKPQHICAIPPYAAALLDNDKLAKMDLSCLITVGLGGDGLNIPLEERINDFLCAHGSKAKVIKGYGMTEVCATAILEESYANKVGSVGIPLPANNLMIYDSDSQQEMHYGEMGEVCLQCASQMMGYKDNQEEMEHLIRVHPDESKWIHTGDLGYVDEEGFLFLIGRMKRIILTSHDGVAYKVYPNIPEEKLNQHAFVHTSCIVGVSNGDDLVLKAYLVLHPEARGNEQLVEHELRTLCEQDLSDYMRPYWYEFRHELPLTPAGKIDYRALEQENETRSAHNA